MCSRVSKTRQSKNSITFADGLLPGDPEDKHRQDYENPEIVTRVKIQAPRERQKNIGTKKSIKARKRNFVEALYGQTGLHHLRGDYESALYLYHRAASLYPKEWRHGAATKRNVAAISSANPSRASSKVLLPEAKNLPQVAANFCPETVASRAKKIIEESSDPVTSIKQILDYFDSRRDFQQDSLTFQDRRSITALTISKAMLKQSSASVSNILKDLQAAFASGDLNKSLKIGVDSVAASEALPNRYHYQVAAHHYLAMIQIALGRHDRAVDQVSRMVRLARGSENVVLWSRSMMTLGKVHLSFGHLDVAARAWEKLVLDVEEAIPKAWLLHEIGRCYFEMKRYTKALATVARCIEYAEEGNSPKWLIHGKLLSGQTLVQLGRYGEAVSSLTVAARVAAEDKDKEMSEYLSKLIHQISAALRIAVYPDEFMPCNAKPMNDLTSKRNFPDDPINSTSRQNYCPSENNNNNSNIRISGRTVSMKKSTINVTRSFSSITELPESARIKNSRINKFQRQRKNIVKDGVTRMSVSLPKGSETFHLSMKKKKKDINRSVTPKSGITVAEGFPHVADLSSIIRGDLHETGDDMLTYRTWVISNETRRDGNSSESWESLDGRKIGNDEELETSSDPDDQQSFWTGKTYVLDRSS